MFDECTTTKVQGTIGLAAAIYYFTKNNYIVSIPLNDSQHYDLIVDKNNTLQRVSVKSTKYKNKYGVYCINLASKGGNKTKINITIFDNNKVDLIFILTDEEKIYLLNSKDIKVKHSLSLHKKLNPIGGFP